MAPRERDPSGRGDAQRFPQRNARACRAIPPLYPANGAPRNPRPVAGWKSAGMIC